MWNANSLIQDLNSGSFSYDDNHYITKAFIIYQTLIIPFIINFCLHTVKGLQV